jgi:hypothetical protein
LFQRETIHPGYRGHKSGNLVLHSIRKEQEMKYKNEHSEGGNRKISEPSLITLEGCSCDACGNEIMPGEHVHWISLDPFADGGGLFAACCSSGCVEHAIEDHGYRVHQCKGK